MEWHNLRSKQASLPGAPVYLLGVQLLPGRYGASGFPDGDKPDNRALYFASQHPLYCADWLTHGGTDYVALSLFREGFHNKIQVVRADYCPAGSAGGDSSTSGGSRSSTSASASPVRGDGRPLGEEASLYSAELVPGAAGQPGTFSFSCAAEATVEYPVTNLQWDPSGHERIAASLEVLRLYRFNGYDSPLVQTHLLANNLATHLAEYDINTFPPVTLFDWNRTDPSIIITSLVDTTCTVWDLNRLHNELAHVKTQLIAHDSEVFDVKFIHMSVNVFGLVSNDGLIRVFDLRLLEHSTIIYEPPHGGDTLAAHHNPQALLKLSTSNVDQHHVATVGVNLNQVLVIDMRMPGVPVVTLDGLFDGMSPGAINLIRWHPNLNLLATGGDDCQALVWDCRTHDKAKLDMPVLAYSESNEVNNVCWRNDPDSWLGVVSGKGFQALET